jgi:predicted nucleic acid-binding protein
MGRTLNRRAKAVDVDPTLDEEVVVAAQVADRVLRVLLRKHPALFAQKRDPIYAPGDEDPLP